MVPLLLHGKGKEGGLTTKKSLIKVSSMDNLLRLLR